MAPRRSSAGPVGILRLATDCTAGVAGISRWDGPAGKATLTMIRILALVFSFSLLAACNGARDLDEAPVPLGDFNLVLNIAGAPKAVKGPLSREVSEEQLAQALMDATAERFSRYQGARDYHFGMSVEGYVLAQPGIPLVFAPKSILIINLTVWDEAQKRQADP